MGKLFRSSDVDRIFLNLTISPELQARVRKCLQEFEMGEFGGRKLTNQEQAAQIVDIQSLVQALEKEF